jgi:dihydroanticapsin dehydrogenase
VYEGVAGRVAIVTGGAQGIGRAISEAFLASGASVTIADIDEARGVPAAAELAKLGRCDYVKTDIADENSVAAMVEHAVSIHGGVDILVNNAAAFIMRGLNASVEDWRRMLDVNVMGYALCSKHCAPRMHDRGGGAIVNISSMSGSIVQRGLLTYSTTKAAVSHLTRLMALELAPTIRVNAVCPGIVWSENNANLIGRTMGLDRAGADSHADLGGRTLLMRVADPNEIAKVVLFLASNDASYITAENVMVDGGYTVL